MKHLFQAIAGRLKDRPGLYAGILMGFFIALGVLALGTVTWDSSYVADEWYFMVISQGDYLEGLLQPWNGHLLGFGFFLFRLSAELFGASFKPFVVMNLIGIAACSSLVYIYAKRRMGPWFAIVPALIPLIYGASSHFYGTGMQMSAMIGVTAVYSLAFGIAALLLAENQTRRSDVLACLFLVLSLSTFSYGLAFAAGIAVGILAVDRKWKRLWIVAIPAVLYVIWRIWAVHKFGAIEDGPEVKNVLYIPFYLFDSLGIVVAGLFGLSDELGRGPVTSLVNGSFHSSVNYKQGLLMLAGLVMLLAALWSTRGRKGLVRATLLPPVVVLASLWLSQALVTDPAIRMPGEPRYLLAGAVLLGIVFAEIYRDFSIPKFVAVGLVAAVSLGVLGNIEDFRVADEVNDREAVNSGVAGAMINLADIDGNPDLVPATEFPEYAYTMNIGAAVYRDLERRQGNIAMPLEEVQDQDPSTRKGADRILAGLYGISALPADTRTAGAQLTCEVLGSGDEIKVGPGLVVLFDSKGTAPKLRRFADEPSVTLDPATDTGEVGFGIPEDESLTPWLLSDGSGKELRVCRPQT